MELEIKSKSFHHGNLKDALIEGAIELIQARKSAAFSLREIATSLGVSHAAAYRHFKSKPDLIAAIALRGFDALKSDLENALIGNPNGKINARQSTLALGHAYLEFAINNAGAYRTLFHPDIISAEAYPELHAASFAALQVLVEIMQAGIDCGDIEDKFDAAQLATSVWAGLHGYASLLLDCQISENGETPAPIAPRGLFLEFLYARIFK